MIVINVSFFLTMKGNKGDNVTTTTVTNNYHKPSTNPVTQNTNYKPLEQTNKQEDRVIVTPEENTNTNTNTNEEPNIDVNIKEEPVIVPDEPEQEPKKRPYLETCLKLYNEEISKKNYENVIRGLSKFIAIEPPVAINQSCKPQTKDIVCSDYKYALGDNTRNAEKERKVAFLIQFGFDVDMLEVFLWEVYDVVDKFFITESIVSHSNKQIRKPLMWDSIKSQPRFARFKDKIVHFIVDDSDVLNPKGDIWVSERRQEWVRWKEFLKWNDYHHEFEETDIVGFGDTDEIVSRDVILTLKKCTGTITTLDVASIFLFGDNKTVFPTDWPVRPYSYSYGDPTFYTIKSAKEYEIARRDTPSRRKGQGDRHIFGGAHISPYFYLPFIINKFVVATEYTVAKIPDGDIDTLDEYFIQYITHDIAHRIRNANDVWDNLKEIHFIPWFIKCNPDRFPRFYGKKDPRIYFTKDQIAFECL